MINRCQIIMLLPVLFITLTVTNIRGEEFEVDTLRFSGNHTYDDSDLEEILHTEIGADFEGRLIKLDKILLTNFYRSKGFLTVEVYDSLRIRRLDKKVDVFYNIIENQRYFLGSIKITGNQLFSVAALRNRFAEAPIGVAFDESKIETAKQAVENLYYDNGKPYVELKLDYEFFRDSLVMVKLDIKENQTIHIRDIRYFGLDHVQEFIVRRELEIDKGDIYSREKFFASQQNIYSTGLFNYVSFSIEPIAADSSAVTLRIDVQEKDPRWIGLRLGFAYEQELSYGNKVELTLEGGHRNLFGTARSLSLHLVPSVLYDIETRKLVNPDNQITMIFVEPWIGYTRTPGVFRLSYHQYRPLNSANFDIYQASFGVSHNFGLHYRASGMLQTKLVNQLTEEYVDTVLVQDAGQDLVYSVSLYGSRSTKNNFFNPSNGSMTDISVAFSHSTGETPTGDSDIKDYMTLVSSWQRYQPLGFKLSRRHAGVTLATRLKGGAILEFGNTKSIPISDLFFAGGATTVRGYPEQLLGPARLDENGYKSQALGGKLLLLMNAEFRVPLFWLFVGEFFIDGGNVWQEIRLFKPTQFKFTTGLGLVMITPIGPVRFDYGIKLMRDDTDRAADAFHLGFYFAF